MALQSAETPGPVQNACDWRVLATLGASGGAAIPGCQVSRSIGIDSAIDALAGRSYRQENVSLFV